MIDKIIDVGHIVLGLTIVSVAIAFAWTLLFVLFHIGFGLAIVNSALTAANVMCLIAVLLMKTKG